MNQPQAQSETHRTPSDADIAYARQLIDDALAPALKEQITKLNVALSKRGIRAGVELTWMFEAIDKPDQPGSITTEEESHESN